MLRAPETREKLLKILGSSQKHPLVEQLKSWTGFRPNRGHTQRIDKNAPPARAHVKPRTFVPVLLEVRAMLKVSSNRQAFRFSRQGLFLMRG
jgi:hypothetical protein